jgi:hypothetical protein
VKGVFANRLLFKRDLAWLISVAGAGPFQFKGVQLNTQIFWQNFSI